MYKQQLEKENLEQRERIEQLNASVEALKRRNTELTNSVFTDAIADLEKKQGYKHLLLFGNPLRVSTLFQTSTFSIFF